MRHDWQSSVIWWITQVSPEKFLWIPDLNSRQVQELQIYALSAWNNWIYGSGTYYVYIDFWSHVQTIGSILVYANLCIEFAMELPILAIANAKEIPGYYDPARFHVHCGIGRWQHCFRFGGRACGKCAFPAARQPGYYWASVCSREWLPQIVQVPVPHFFSLIIALTSFPSFQFTFNCD